MDILTNNIDRGQYKIRIHKGILAQKANEKRHEELSRIYATKKGILPFYYFDKTNNRQKATGCIRGSFYLGDDLVHPGTGLWCATKLDAEQNMIEWGYWIDKTFTISSLQRALDLVEQLIEAEKLKHYIIGFLKTYILDTDLAIEVFDNETYLELMRNKNIFPDVKKYDLGQTITVRGKEYILEDDLELGRGWKAVHVIIKKLPIPDQPEQAEKQYSSNKSQDGRNQIHAYQGIIDEYRYRLKRGDNRKETIKECVPSFEYMNKHNKRVKNESICIEKDMTMNETFIGPEGGKWCATEIDDTGLMREWGYCIKNIEQKPISKTEKTIWEEICSAIQYEQWSKISTFSRKLLLEGHTQYSIFNNLQEICDPVKTGPFFNNIKRKINIEFIKLSPWTLVKANHPNIDKLQIKPNISYIIFNKLEYLEKGIHINFHSNLISKDDVWLLTYYFIVERMIVRSIISDTEDFDMILLKQIKKTQSIQELNTVLLDLEQHIKKEIIKYITGIDSEKNVLIDLNAPNADSNSKKTISPNLIIVNYSSFFGTITQEQRVLYYSPLDLASPLAIQLAFYNKSFVEVTDVLEEAKSELEAIEQPIQHKVSSNSEWNDDDKQYYSNYPELSDPLFYTKLHYKKEFQINKMSSWKDKKIEDLCRVDVFELSPQQQWVSNYFNIETHYKGLLLYWGTGVGKTCASISIAERHLEYYKKYNKKILVILGSSTEQNYKKELYNYNKEKIEIKQGLIPGTLQCTGDRYYIPIQSNDPESVKKRESRILKRIEQDYEFITYGSLKGLLKSLLNKRGLQLELDDQKQSIPKKPPQVLDEEIKSGTITYRAVKTLRGLIWRAIEVKDPQKEERIRLALSDYFSNRLIIIDEIQNIRTASEGGDQIAPKMLEQIVHYSHDLKIVLMSATPMFNNATEIIYILNLLLENDNKPKIKLNELFDSKDNLTNPEKLLESARGYISYVRGANPISFPKKLVPVQSDINQLYYPNPDTKMNGHVLTQEERVKYNSVIKCDMSDYQEAIFRKSVLGETDANVDELADITNETFDIKGKMISNIVYPLPPKSTFPKTDVTLLYGDKGFERCFNETKNNKYEYNIENSIGTNRLPILDSSNLEIFAPKMSKIIQNIKNTDKGIIFVYSEYKKGGSLPFALALEQNGFEQLVIEGKNGGLAIKNKLQSGLKQPLVAKRWKYILLDGDIEAKKREKLIQKCNSEENKEGNLIKVIIGTRVASEGVDFSRIRQIHIFNPWDNFSRIDQTIGRGIRNCSHKDLPEEDRNVTVFLYCSHISDNSIETTDEKIHRRAERKDIQMKEVEFILRNSAVDCISNFTANKYTIEDFGEEIGDKDNTRQCGYKKCEEIYQCTDYSTVPQVLSNSDMDKDTYNIEYHANREIDKYKSIIKMMFTKSVVFKLKHFKTVCEMKINPFDESIFFISLDKLIYNKEKLYDKYHRIGRIIFKDGYYLFQPNDLDKTLELPDYYRQTPLTVKPSKAEVQIREKTISKELLLKWYTEVTRIVAKSSDPDRLAYYLDRVKDVVMKKIFLEWFNYLYDDSAKATVLQENITEYLTNKDVIINDSDDNPIAIHWTKELSYEYLVEQKELVERMNVESLQKKMIIYNFDNYNLNTHVIGRLEQISNGKEESPLKQMTCKIIDFSFAEKKSNIKLDGKSCMSYNKPPMIKLMENLEIEIEEGNKREDQCEIIELTLRQYHREHRGDDKVWWIESNKSYKLDKIL
jgi:hypothetical protein